jgi:hypothetical protein
MRSFGPAEIAAARPTTVIRSRLPRALTRKTQKPFVVMERPAKTSVLLSAVVFTLDPSFLAPARLNLAPVQTSGGPLCD